MKTKIAFPNQARRCFGAGLRAAVSVTMLLLFTTPGSGVERQVLRGHVPTAVARLGLMPAGRLPATNRLHLAFGLPLRNTNALNQLLQDMYDPASPQFHRYLTPEQFTEQFGPTRQDYEAIVQFAKSHGLEITATHSNRVLLEVAGKVADIEKAFQVTLRTYSHPREQRVFYASDVEPSLDLVVPVLHISGLDNYVVPHPMYVKKIPVGNATGPTPVAGSGPSGTYMGNDFRAAYVPGASLTGSGQVVGLLEFDGYYTNDITAYENQAGLPNVPLKNVLLDGFGGAPGYDNVEVALDIDMAICMAPGLSAVITYEGYLTDSILNRMATDNLAKQLSASWTYGIDAVTEQIFQQFAAQGQSFFNASGDYDAWVGYVYPPCDDPYITIVGGTTLTTTGPGGSWVSETVWNWGNGTGSGGGISTTYPIPTWQQGIDMTANHGSTTMRNIPDVALTADNVFVIADNGSPYSIGGTSAATPLWAGFIALVNQQAVASSNSLVGFINPAIYLIGVEPDYASAFHDITTGNNVWFGSSDLFFAVPGYDLCTGWGTPAGTNLIKALAMPEALNITPRTGFSATGRPGGPFDVTSHIFTLTNVGAATLDWTLANTSLWLSASPSGGTLTQGGPATSVIVSLTSAAYNLPVGVYAANIRFINLNDVVVQSRQFTLTVINPPAITAQPTNQAVFWGATTTFTVAASGGLPLSYQWQANGMNLKDGGNIAGSATSTLTLDNVSLADVGPYSVIVSNAVGSISSSSAFLKVISSSPIITVQPTNQTAMFGSQASFAVGAVGNEQLFYQWQSNGTNLTDAGKISGSGTASLTVSNVSSSDMGIYSVAVSNALGSVTSTGAVLAVVVAEPGVQLVQNGGFETGSFYAWSQSGNFADCSVSTSSPYVHSGTYGALLGPVGSLGYLSQSLPTVAGQVYLLSLWLDCPDGLGPNEFQVAWNGTVMFDQTNLGAIGWTNLQFVVTATGTNTLLQLGFRNDQSFLGLDDIQVSSLVSADGPPIIVIQPASQTAAIGGTNSFSVLSAGQLPLLYQWQFNATNIPNATNATLVLTNVTAHQMGVYDVLVSNSLGSATSSNALLGSGIVVSTTNWWNKVSYVSDFGYPNTGTYGQTFIPPAQSSVLNSFTVYIENLSAYVDFRFYVMAWNGSEATGPILYQSPETSTAGASGFQPYTFNMGNVGLTPGATYVAFASITPDCPGYAAWGILATNYPYTSGEFVYNNNGTDFSLLTDTVWTSWLGSDLAFVAVFGGSLGPPIITQEPVSQSVEVGASPTFCVTASGDPPLYYFWQCNGTNIAGATNSCYTTNNVQLSNSGSQFSCLVSNAFGSALSSNALLTVVSNVFIPNSITNILVFYDFDVPTPLAAALTNLGLPYVFFDEAEEGSFTDAVNSADPATTLVIADTVDYQHVFAGLATYIGNGGRAILYYWDLATLASIASAFDATVYQSFTSPLPVYNWGGSSLFTGVTTPMSFAKIGLNIDGQQLQPTGAGQAVGGFVSSSNTDEAAIIIGNTNRTILNGFTFEESTSFSNAVQLARNEIQLIIGSAASVPSIVTQPASETISVGSNVTFSVTASGSLPLSYSWSRNGRPIPGATLTNYTINSVQLSDSGSQFSCLVSNRFGTANSSNAVLVVFPPSLVQNGGFEAGNFSFWTMSGNLNSAYGLVTANSSYVHSGQYGAQLGPAGALGYLSQTLTTSIGQLYLISLWLNSFNGATPNEFLVSWNGTNLYDQVNVGATGWTNLQFFATAAGTNTVLAFGLRNDPSYFGLDDIIAYPVTPPQLQTMTLTNGTISFGWSAQVGLLYQLQYTTNLASGNWTSLGSAVTATGATLSAIDTVTNCPQRFYRLMLSP